MKRFSSQHKYSLAELVAAAYTTAGQETRNCALAALLARKIVEDWLMHSDRPDLVKQLETASS
jgi:hypothetical protein